MARKGASKAMKRLGAPDHWRIMKKEYTFAQKPLAGPHPARDSFTLGYVVRDLFKLATTAREAKHILTLGLISIDGKVRKDLHFPVGLMDVVEFTPEKKAYRVLPDRQLNLKLVEITKDKDVKLCKILDKTSLKGGNIQLNLHDGRNILLKIEDPTDPKEDIYKVGDVLKINLNSKEITGHIKMGKDKLAIVVAGNNNGRHGNI
nr:30S ribosomal protein S4e [Candidatus Sigynarchaeota archaeon]